MNMDRRDFIKSILVAASGLAAADRLSAQFESSPYVSDQAGRWGAGVFQPGRRALAWIHGPNRVFGFTAVGNGQQRNARPLIVSLGRSAKAQPLFLVFIHAMCRHQTLFAPYEEIIVPAGQRIYLYCESSEPFGAFGHIMDENSLRAT